MKDHKHQPMSPTEVTNRVWEIADDIKTCMFTTWNGEEQRSQPMMARLNRQQNEVYFLTDVEGDLNKEITAYPVVSLAWADNGSYRYSVISGHATLTDDRAKISELWSEMDKAWWHGKDDPTIRLITVTPHRGEIWDSPGKLVSGAKMLMAAMTGSTPEMGENASVKL